MKIRLSLSACLCCLGSLAIVAAEASAVLHPRLGQYVQRDRDGNSISRPDVTAFAPRDPLPTGYPDRLSVQSQYLDGLNLYQYVRSAPTTSLDPYGLRRIRVHPSQAWKWRPVDLGKRRPQVGPAINGTRTIREGRTDLLEWRAELQIGTTESWCDNGRRYLEVEPDGAMAKVQWWWATSQAKQVEMKRVEVWAAHFDELSLRSADYLLQCWCPRTLACRKQEHEILVKLYRAKGLRAPFSIGLREAVYGNSPGLSADAILRGNLIVQTLERQLAEKKNECDGFESDDL